MDEQNKTGIFKSAANLVGGTLEVLNSKVDVILEKAKKRGLYEVQRISIVDNLEMAQPQEDYLERFSFLNYDTMSLTAKRDVIVASIIARRISQLIKFARPSKSKYETGFRIVKSDGTEPMDEQEIMEIQSLTDWISHVGYLDRPPEQLMNFEEFIRRETYDLMVFDQISIEKIPANDGSIHSLWPLDAATIRRARKSAKPKTPDQLATPGTMNTSVDFESEQIRTAAMEERHEDIEPGDIAFVQVVNGRIVTQYTREDIIFKLFSPINDVKLNGYSLSPIEKLINIITSHIFAESHNRFFFTQGFSSRGILVLRGNIPQQQLDAFRRQWYAQVSGASNSWRTPILGGEELQVDWVPLSMNNRDMEWELWMEYLVKVICAVYLISPIEIGWAAAPSGVMMGDSGKRNEILLTESKDVGLDPILRFFEDIINEQILPFVEPKIAGKYKFTWVGLGQDDPSIETDRLIRQLANYKTLNEVRYEAELPPIDPPMGDMILNPALMPIYEAMMFPEKPDDGAKSKDKAGKTKKKKDKEKKGK